MASGGAHTGPTPPDGPGSPSLLPDARRQPKRPRDDLDPDPEAHPERSDGDTSPDTSDDEDAVDSTAVGQAQTQGVILQDGMHRATIAPGLAKVCSVAAHTPITVFSLTRPPSHPHGYRTVLHRAVPHRTAPHRTASHRTAPHRTAPHRTTPHRITPHRTAPPHPAPSRPIPSHPPSRTALHPSPPHATR